MRKWIPLLFAFIYLLTAGGCGAQTPAANPTDVPEDFSFALTWNCNGVSSYDSETGKLVKTSEASNPDTYVTYYRLTEEDRKYIYSLLSSLDINTYPDIYDPKNDASKPPMTLILTVRINGETKTVKAENIGLSFTSEDEKGQRFLSVCEAICNRLTATAAWNALPAPETLYQ